MRIFQKGSPWSAIVSGYGSACGWENVFGFLGTVGGAATGGAKTIAPCLCMYSALLVVPCFLECVLRRVELGWGKLRAALSGKEPPSSAGAGSTEAPPPVTSGLSMPILRSGSDLPGSDTMTEMESPHTPTEKIQKCKSQGSDTLMSFGSDYSLAHPVGIGGMSQEDVTDEVKRVLDPVEPAVLKAPLEPIPRKESMLTHAASFSEPTEGKVAVFRVGCL